MDTVDIFIPLGAGYFCISLSPVAHCTLAAPSGQTETRKIFKNKTASHHRIVPSWKGSCKGLVGKSLKSVMSLSFPPCGLVEAPSFFLYNNGRHLHLYFMYIFTNQRLLSSLNLFQ